MTKYVLIDDGHGHRGYLRFFSGNSVDKITGVDVTLNLVEAAPFENELHTYGVYNVLKGRFSGKVFICNDIGEIELEILWPKLE